MTLGPNDLWNSILEQARAGLPEQAFRTWISSARAVSCSGGVLHVAATSRFHAEWLEDKYGAVVREIAERVAGEPLELRITSADAPADRLSPEISVTRVVEPEHDAAATAPGAPAMPPPPGLNARYTFDRFIVGDNNRLAHAAALAVADRPASTYNPLFLYGATGLGKTHLMQAIGNFIRSRNSDARILYCHCQVFLESMVEAVRLGGGAMQQFARRYQSADALLVDDIQFIAGAPQTQKEFLRIFNRLWDSGRQIVVTCDRYPRFVKGLDGSLKSRLSGGLHVQIKPPSKAMRVAILKSKAESRGVSLSEEVAGYIATVANANVRELDGALQSVIGQAQFIGDEVTLELAQDALRHLVGGPGRIINIGEILRTVADHYDVKAAEILSKRRYRHLVRSRHVAMYLVKELTNRSYSDIGKEFGGSHHTTVKSACAKIERLIQTDPELDEEIRSLVSDLKR
jgi:chromosomal replication initiator protein